jgi:hypothetical protein
MIIVKLQGGLGNQLFQYTFGRAMSLKKRTDLKLDISNYKDDPLRAYKLKYFNIEEDIASRAQVFLAKITTRLGLATSYLEGYWQGEKYFEDIKDIIKKDFTLKNPPSEATGIFIDQIKNTNAVSLHVRRGDYVTNEKLKNILQALPLSYYNDAIDLMSKKTEQPHFFIFSDDIAWVKENLEIKYPVTYVSGESMPDYEELILMSLCKHNIIANSSFSCWGAWLNKNLDKIVIAPKNWFPDQAKDTKDLIPASWIQL